MTVKKETRKIWLVKHPLYIYKEDVKDLARRNNLKIICESQSQYVGDDFRAAKPPKLTVKDEFKPKEADKLEA